MTDGDGAPLDDIARRTRERRRDRDRTDAEADDWDHLFESVDQPELDSDAVWDALTDDDDATTGVGFGAEPDAVESDRGVHDEYVVPKHEYCQRCPHFSDPPTVACGHEGTAIVEVVDTDRFRVRDCPVVSGHRGRDRVGADAAADRFEDDTDAD